MNDEAVIEETHQNNETKVFETNSRGQTVLHTSKDNLIETIEQLHSDGFKVCIDAVSYTHLTLPTKA